MDEVEKPCIICSLPIGEGRFKYCSDRCSKVAAYKRQGKYMKEYDRKLRKQVLDLLGGICKRCGIDDVRVLQIDHIAGNGYKEMRENGWCGGRAHRYYRHILEVSGEGYQVLCANCNWIKRYEKNEHN